MKSYIKIYGPPMLESIRALERIAVDMPEVCMMHQSFVEGLSPHIARDIGLEPQRRSSAGASRYDPRLGLVDYFRKSGVTITQERCMSIISKSGESLGEYDFFFEWSKKPNTEQLNDLIVKIDEALAPLGSRYTITTRPR